MADGTHVERPSVANKNSETRDMEKWSYRLKRSSIFKMNYKASPNQARELTDLAESLGLLKDKRSENTTRRKTADCCRSSEGSQIDAISSLRTSSTNMRESATGHYNMSYRLWRFSSNQASLGSSMDIGVSQSRLDEHACSVLINTNAVLLKQGPILLDESGGCANDWFLREEEVQPRELFILTDAFMVCTINAPGVDSKVRILPCFYIALFQRKRA